MQIVFSRHQKQFLLNKISWCWVMCKNLCWRVVWCVVQETTAHEVVMLALQEFGMTEPSSHFSLCEVSVAEGGIIKQKRLPDQLQNLAERIGLSSRWVVSLRHCNILYCKLCAWISASMCLRIFIWSYTKQFSSWESFSSLYRWNISVSLYFLC